MRVEHVAQDSIAFSAISPNAQEKNLRDPRLTSAGGKCYSTYIVYLGLEEWVFDVPRRCQENQNKSHQFNFA